jgi:Sigma-70 region 2
MQFCHVLYPNFPHTPDYFIINFFFLYLSDGTISKTIQPRPLVSDTHHTDPKNDPASDKLLFRLISEGDESAFRDIFHAYRKILYPVVLSLVKVEADAKEILQETFLKLWLKRETLTEIESPGGWLYSVASTEALMHLRKESRYARRLQKAGAETRATADTDLRDIHEQFDS